MKLQIDTNNKTITIDENVLLKNLIEELDKIFPNGSWKYFILLTNPIINWINPIVIEPYVPNFPYPTYPWITYGNTGTSIDNSNTDLNRINYNTGTYNIEFKEIDNGR